MHNTGRIPFKENDWLIQTGYFMLLTNNRTNWKAQSTSSTVLSHMRQVGLGIKGNGLITTVITGHVALAAVNAQVFVNQSHNLLPVIQVTISSNTSQGCTNDILLTWFLKKWIESFRFEDDDGYDYEICLKVSRILKIYTPRRASFHHLSLENLALLPLVKGVKPSPDRKMLKLLTFDNLFPPLRHSR